MSEASLSASLIPPLHKAHLDSAAAAQKDRYGIIPYPREEGSNRVSCGTGKCNGSGGYVVAETGDEVHLGGSTCNHLESHTCQFLSQHNNSGLNHNSPRICSSNGRVKNIPQIQGRDMSDGLCPKHNAFASATEVSARVPLPPFEFYVSSEQGINLCVDLDSSPLDWIESLKNEVNLCQNWQSNKSQSLQQDIGCFKDSDTEMKTSSLGNIDSSQTKNKEVTEENSDLGANHPNFGDGCLMSSELPCDGTVNVLEEIEKDHSLESSKSFSDSKNQRKSGTDTCPIDGYTMILDSKVDSTPKMKSMCNSPVKSISCGPCVTSSEQPSSNLCENTTVANNVSRVTTSAVFSVFSASCSMENQLSGVASYHTSSAPCKNGRLPKFFVPPHIERGLCQAGNTSELEHNTSGSHFQTLFLEKERSKTINRMDSSDCSQLISFESNMVRSDGFESHEERSRKKPRIDGEVQSDCSQPNTRGRKRHAGKLLPRRSLRLVTK